MKFAGIDVDELDIDNVVGVQVDIWDCVRAMIQMNNWEVGEYIIYRNGEKYEIGRIKSIHPDGCFIAYHSGETGAKTPFELMHKLINAYTIKETTLGGDFFK